MTFSRPWRAASLAAAAFGIACLAIAAPAIARNYLQPFLLITPGISPDASIMLSGATNVRVATFSLEAKRENLLVDTLTFHNCIAETDVDGDCADDGEVLGDDAAATAVTLSYLDDDGGLTTASSTLSGGVATFTDLALPIDNGDTTLLTVMIDTPEIDNDTITSGMQLQLNLNGKALSLLATGRRSGLEVRETNVKKNVMAHTMTLRSTEPTFRLAERTPSGTAAVGDTDALRFTVTPSEEDTDMTLRGVTFALQTTDKRNSDWNACRQLGGDDARFTLINERTGEVITGAVDAYDTSGDPCSDKPKNTVGLVSIAFSEWVALTEQTAFLLTVDTDGASAKAHDTLRVSLTDQEKLDRIDDVDLAAIIWSDGTASKLADGSGVDYLPLKGKTISF